MFDAILVTQSAQAISAGVCVYQLDNPSKKQTSFDNTYANQTFRPVQNSFFIKKQQN